MKAVLMSIQPKWCELIASGKKTVEVRKTRPKLDTPFKVYIYCTKSKEKTFFTEELFDKYAIPYVGNCKVIGEFVCDEIYNYTASPVISEHIKAKCSISDEDMVKQSCMTLKELYHYESQPESHNWGLLGWHISNLIIYDRPKELTELSNIDNVAIKKCEHRERIYTNPTFTNGAYLPGSYVCTKNELDWCSKCKTKSLLKPPHSWCYVEEKE